MKFWLSCCSEPLPGRRSQIKALLVRIRFREGRPPGQNGSVGADLRAAPTENGKAKRNRALTGIAAASEMRPYQPPAKRIRRMKAKLQENATSAYWELSPRRATFPDFASIHLSITGNSFALSFARNWINSAVFSADGIASPGRFSLEKSIRSFACR